ncbi:MAG: hypothetical protein J1E60_07625 [Christensenellaceae bacterium]|nr:hypothetical protein [Christensenellaceae bacterium]
MCPSGVRAGGIYDELHPPLIPCGIAIALTVLIMSRLAAGMKETIWNYLPFSAVQNKED